MPNNPDQSIRLGVVDDHPTFREGLVSSLNKKKSFNVIFTAESGVDLYRNLSASKINLLLLDINLPEVNGFDILKTITKKYPHIKVIILSAHQDGASRVRAFKNGAKGYLTKDTPIANIILAIEKVHKGHIHMTEDTKKILDSGEVKEAVYLTDREMMTLRLICAEKSSQEIADHLNISVNTVNNHRKSLLKKVGASSIVGLIKYAYLQGFVD